MLVVLVKGTETKYICITGIKDLVESLKLAHCWMFKSSLLHFSREQRADYMYIA
jgi:hypothetical protein